MAPTRILRALAALSLAVVAVAMPAAASAAVDGSPSAGAPRQQLAASSDMNDTNDFSYASWDALYEIGLDDEGRSRMHVTETLVARFPETDQNQASCADSRPRTRGRAPRRGSSP